MIQLLRSNDPVKRVRNISFFVSTMLGLSSGLALFIWGPLFYEQLAGQSDNQMGIALTAALISFSNVLGFFLEVPTGALGDAMGRKWSVVISFICKALQMLLLAVVPFCTSVTSSMTIGLFSIIFFQIAYTFYSGTFTAWCVDALREANPKIGFEYILAPSSKYRSLGTMIGGVIGIILYTNDLAYLAFLVSAAACTITAATCLAEMEDNQSIRFLDKTKLTMGAIVRSMGDIIGEALSTFKASPAILAAVTVFAAFMSLLNLAEYYWPIYISSIETSSSAQTTYWLSLAALTMFSRAVGSQTFSLFSKYSTNDGSAAMSPMSLRKSLVITSMLSALPVLWLSWQTINDKPTLLWMMGAVIGIEIAYGIIMPCFETLVNNNIPDHRSGERATVLSFASLLRGLLVTLLAIPAGGASGAATTAGWSIPALILLIVAIVSNIIIKRTEQCAPDILNNGSLIERSKQ